MHSLATFFKKIINSTLQKLIVASLMIGLLSAFLAIVLKRMTEYYEAKLMGHIGAYPTFVFVFPLIGLTVIYFLRQYLFKKKENKGIREIFESTERKSKNLPLYKIPSHFINGFLTVIFGGSTGIEVSTVVASATIGSVAQQKESALLLYKTELIAAGVAAGITALFSSPIAGILFALEVISRKTTKVFFMTTILAVAIASGLLFVIAEKPLFALNIKVWHFYAIPYFIILGILAGMHSVYLTKSVLFFKSLFSKITVHYHRILISSFLISVLLLVFPVLYGDGYRGIKILLFSSNGIPLTLPIVITLIGFLVFKPIVTSVTLASGGDGGVFAPSLFLGAFLGYLLAVVLNTYFDAGVVPVNFVIIGMAAMLSASIHAPFTALFLVCGMINNYTLFFPILAICLISKYTAKMLYPFTVYTFVPNTLKT